MRRLSAFLAVLVVCLLPAGVARAQYVMDIGNLMAAIQVGDLNEAVEGVNGANTVYVARVSELAGYGINRERLARVVANRGGVLRYFARRSAAGA